MDQLTIKSGFFTALIASVVNRIAKKKYGVELSFCIDSIDVTMKDNRFWFSLDGSITTSSVKELVEKSLK